MQTNKFQMWSREQIGAAKNRKGFGCIGVVLSRRRAFLRTKKLYSLFHGLLRNNEATREVPIV